MKLEPGTEAHRAYLNGIEYAKQDPAVADTRCNCKRSDAWMCAVDQSLRTVSCHCSCHNKLVPNAES